MERYNYYQLKESNSFVHRIPANDKVLLTLMSPERLIYNYSVLGYIKQELKREHVFEVEPVPIEEERNIEMIIRHHLMEQSQNLRESIGYPKLIVLGKIHFW